MYRCVAAAANKAACWRLDLHPWGRLQEAAQPPLPPLLLLHRDLILQDGTSDSVHTLSELTTEGSSLFQPVGGRGWVGGQEGGWVGNTRGAQSEGEPGGTSVGGEQHPNR